MELSKEHKKKVDKIVDYLKNGGCSKIFLFGSLAENGERSRPGSDIDIAVSGISSKEYFKAVAMLPFLVKHKVDLIDLEQIPQKFKHYIEQSGVLLYAN